MQKKEFLIWNAKKEFLIWLVEKFKVSGWKLAKWRVNKETPEEGNRHTAAGWCWENRSMNNTDTSGGDNDLIKRGPPPIPPLLDCTT